MRRDDNDDDFDREAPDRSDTDDGDGDVLDPCPNCRKLMYDDSEQCPHCGHYLDLGETERATPTWTIVIAAAIVVGGVVAYLGRLF